MRLRLVKIGAGLLAVFVSQISFAWSVNETRYLAFQIFTSSPNPEIPVGGSGTTGLASLPSLTSLKGFVGDIKKRIGTCGKAGTRLAVIFGPLSFDHTDDEVRQLIHNGFKIARETDVAVGFHIDDSMFWAKRTDLLANPKNLETADWKQVPNTGRRVDWGPEPTKFPPQMCFNSPEIEAAATKRASLIGSEVRKEVSALDHDGKGYLFAGVIAGWETMIGRDFATNKALGYRALQNEGFSESNPPKDADSERSNVVKGFIKRWCDGLHDGGIGREKIFCHIAFTPQGLDSTSPGSHFSPADVAFGPGYRPGFSTYPDGDTFKEVYSTLARHDSPSWISSEGTNVSPSGAAGERTMETYLGRMFNHGAVMVNVFSWGMGGEAMRDNFFRKATEGPEALAAYAKFLRGETLVEGPPAMKLSDKIHKIQSELPGWIQRTGRQSEAEPLVKRLQAALTAKDFSEAETVADLILKLIS